MNRADLLKWIRLDGAGLVDRFLPSGARAGLEDVILDRRHEVNADAYLMFASISALLRKDGMASCDSDREAGRIMAAACVMQPTHPRSADAMIMAVRHPNKERQCASIRRDSSSTRHRAGLTANTWPMPASVPAGQTGASTTFI